MLQTLFSFVRNKLSVEDLYAKYIEFMGEGNIQAQVLEGKNDTLSKRKKICLSWFQSIPIFIDQTFNFHRFNSNQKYTSTAK